MPRILVVDDDACALDYMVELLGEHYQVVSATDGDRALDVLEAGKRVDLLLTDIRMPGLNGIALARMAVMRDRDLPVVYMSGCNEPALQNVGTLFGPILTKPFTGAVLLAAVEEALGARPRRAFGLLARRA